MKKLIDTPIQILILFVFIIMGASMWISDNPFRWDTAGTPCTFDYIRQGGYTLTVSCTPPGDQANRVTVFSDAATNTSGKAGVIIAQADLAPGQTSVSIPLSLEEGLYAVCIATDLDTEDSSYVTGAHLESNGILYRDGAFLGCLCFAAAFLLAVVFLKIPREKYIYPLGAVLIGLLAGIPLYADFILIGMDLTFHILRIEGIYQAIASGDFPVRLNPLQMSGYGYLSPTMYPQMFLYPAAVLRFLNVSIFTCYKLLLTIFNIVTALIAYYAAKHMTKSDKIGILASFLYTFSAYRLICLYLRASLGEVLAMAFYPLLLWGIYECLWGEKRWFIAVLGMTGILGTHVLSIEMCALFVILELLWWLCSRKKSDVKKRIIAGMKAVAVTILLNFFFIVPFLYFSAQNLKCFEQYNISAISVLYFSQMFSLFLRADGASIPRGTTLHEMSLTVGTALLVGLSAFFVWSGKHAQETRKNNHMTGVHCAAYGLLSLYLTSWLMPWGALIVRFPLIDRLSASLQFVWRFLGLASLFLVFCASIALISLWEERKELSWLTGAVVVLCLVSSWSFFDELTNLDRQSLNLMAMEGTSDVDELYLYTYSSRLDFSRETAEPRTANETPVTFSDYRKKGTHISTNVTPLVENEDDFLIFPLYYYPGYEIKVNGEKTEVFCVDSLTACRLPSAQSKIEIRYTGLPVFWAADFISLLTISGICLIFMRKRFHKKL